MARPRPEEEPVTIMTREARRVDTRGVVMVSNGVVMGWNGVEEGLEFRRRRCCCRA